MSSTPHRYAIFHMNDGPDAGPVCEADTSTGATLAITCLANEGAPGWYVVVDRAPDVLSPAARVSTYFAPEGVRQVDLYPCPPHRPWTTAARDAA